MELSREILRAKAEDSLPYLDRFEIWALDPGTGRPIALLKTERSLEEAEFMEYLPLWRFKTAPELPAEIVQFQELIELLFRKPRARGGFHIKTGIFERHTNGSATQHGASGATIPISAAEFPDGLLAEPWEAERLRLAEEYGLC
jgi:hypothetical protein